MTGAIANLTCDSIVDQCETSLPATIRRLIKLTDYQQPVFRKDTWNSIVPGGVSLAKSAEFRGAATVKNRAGTSTRTMQMSRLVAGLSAIVGVFLITLLFSQNSKAIASYGLGALVIVSAGVFAGIKYLEKYGLEKAKRSKHAERGAEAEEAVGAILDNTPEGNFVIHDFNSGRGNIDHILIGPKGIFTLETKSHAGKVSFDGEKLLRNGRPFEKDFLKQAWAQCYLVRGILAKWGITTPLPEPVILFTNAFIEVRGKAKGIEIVGIKDLPKFLERLPDKISTPEAGRIYNRIGAASKK